MQLPANGYVEESVVRNTAPQSERQSRSQLDIRNMIHGSRSRARRIRLDAEQKIWAYQHTLQRGANPVIEGSSGARAAVETKQRLHIVARSAPPISPASQIRQDLCRARRLLIPIRGLAQIQQLAAWRIGGHLPVIRTADQK